MYYIVVCERYNSSPGIFITENKELAEKEFERLKGMRVTKFEVETNEIDKYISYPNEVK